MDQLVARIDQLTTALNDMIARNAEQEAQIRQLNQRVDQNRNHDALLKIPDPIKSIPGYDGNKKQLASWLRTVETTLNRYDGMINEATSEIYLQTIINKLDGKARDTVCLAGEINSFNQLREILTDALGDRQELSTYKCQLWHNKMHDDTSIFEYYTNTKNIVQNIKTLTKQTALYNGNWEAVNALIDEDAIAAFISGLRRPYFGYVQAARPNNIEEAYAFLCKFQSNEKNSSNMKIQKTNKKSDWEPKPSTSRNKDEPMEIDPSLKSKMTLNNKLFNNNHEVEKEEISSEEITSEEDTEEIETNFWSADLENPPT